MSDTRTRIKALLVLAEHPGTPQAEAESALAMASKLMQKHGLTNGDIGDDENDDDIDVVMERIAVSGRYRVRRANLLYAIAFVHSCAGYRDDDEGTSCVVVLYGRRADIFAARTLWAAADQMAARLLPRGDRSARTAWLKGFQSGIEDALSAARAEHIAETSGAGIVLADRFARARAELRASGVHLRGGTTWVDSSSAAWKDGERAGRGFGASGRSFTSGVFGELG